MKNKAGIQIYENKFITNKLDFIVNSINIDKIYNRKNYYRYINNNYFGIKLYKIYQDISKVIDI
jgi:hypothetical protein